MPTKIRLEILLPILILAGLALGLYFLLIPRPSVPLENYPGVIGWEADKDGIIAYYDGSFYVREGKNQRFNYGIFNKPAYFTWDNCAGYLPCLVIEFMRDGATIQIINFGDQVTLNCQAYVAIYNRVAITNHTDRSLKLLPAPSAGLIPLTTNSSTVQPGQLHRGHFYFIGFNLPPQIFQGTTDHQTRDENCYENESQRPIKPRADASKIT